MSRFGIRFEALARDRWLVFVAAMWVQSCAGIGYLFGSISPVIKTSMGYNQRQIAMLGVAKDLGDSVGFLAGSLSEVLPTWALLLIGVFQNFVGYGTLWLIVTQRLSGMPLWVLCLCIYIGTNGETFFNTAALISCVQNFPKNRGPIVGILKGFAGLSGAILSQVYLSFNASSQSSIILTIAIGPSLISAALMPIVRPVNGGHKQVKSSDGRSFSFVYAVCLVLAIYLLVILVLEDLLSLSQGLISLFAGVLIVLVVLPIAIPLSSVFCYDVSPDLAEQEESLVSEDETVIMSEVEDEKPRDLDRLPRPERRKRMAQLQAKLVQAAAEGAVRIRRRAGPRRGEDFTLTQALMKADFWLMFASLVLASGSGVTVIDNLGQMTQSLGYEDSSIFISMISIWNFLGRVGGGYFSEIITRDYAYPRPVAIAIVQVIMAFGFFYYAMAWPGQIYVVSVLIGLGYGAHWAVLPASASELFGLKSFGALYNFLILANPVGSLVFSGVIASGIYDYYAEKQASISVFNLKHLGDEDSSTCVGSVCYALTCGILSVLCVVAAALSSIVVYRTRRVYAQLYGKALG